MLYIYLKSYDSYLLNSFCKQIFLPKIKNQHNIKGPVFLPKKQNFYTVIRSPHIYSLSRERFEITVFTQIFVIDLYSNIFKKEFPEGLRRMNYFFYEWVPSLLFRGQPRTLLFYKLLKKSVPAGISLKFFFK